MDGGGGGGTIGGAGTRRPSSRKTAVEDSSCMRRSSGFKIAGGAPREREINGGISNAFSSLTWWWDIG